MLDYSTQYFLIIAYATPARQFATSSDITSKVNNDITNRAVRANICLLESILLRSANYTTIHKQIMPFLFRPSIDKITNCSLRYLFCLYKCVRYILHSQHILLSSLIIPESKLA